MKDNLLPEAVRQEYQLGLACSGRRIEKLQACNLVERNVAPFQDCAGVAVELPPACQELPAISKQSYFYSLAAEGK